MKALQGGIKDVILTLKALLRTDKDAVVAITADEGEGKSTLGLELCMNMGHFSLRDNVIYFLKELNDKMTALPKFSPILLDEGMEAMYKRNWMSNERKNLNTLFSMCRRQNLAFFLCMPNFWDFDAYYRNHRIKMWIWIPERGLAIVFGRSKNPYTSDPWNQKANETIINKAWVEGGRDRDSLLKGVMNTPNFLFAFTFEDLPTDLKKEYQAIKTENWEKLQEVLAERMAVDNWQLWYGNFVANMIEQHELTRETIAFLSGNVERNIMPPDGTTVSKAVTAASGFNSKFFKARGKMTRAEAAS